MNTGKIRLSGKETGFQERCMNRGKARFLSRQSLEWEISEKIENGRGNSWPGREKSDL